MPIDRYLDHLAYEKRCSAHTVLAYRRDLVQFVAFLSGHGGVPIERATDRMIRLWMMQLMEQGTGPRSVNRKLSALRAATAAILLWVTEAVVTQMRYR